jgi:hypothetical protein
MSWRPEGWHNPYDGAFATIYFREIFRHPGVPLFRIKAEREEAAFELGADAILEALKKKGAWMTPEQMKLLAPDRQYPFGYMVFIPDDKEPPQPQRGMTLLMAANVLEHLKNGELPGTVSELDQACGLGVEAIKRIQAIREGLSISPYVDLPGELRPERREAC